MKLVALALLTASSVTSAADVNYSPVKTNPPPSEITETDHEAIRLRAGLGYFGWMRAPLGVHDDRVTAHLIGLRYWFRRSVGLDFALGGNVEAGSGSSAFAGAARVSLPIAFLVEKHITLFAAPAIGFAVAGRTIARDRAFSPITGLEQAVPDARDNGMRVSVGLRVGAEIHFGFVGIQRLALSGAIGLDGAYSRQRTSAAGPSTTREPEPRAVETRAQRFAVESALFDLAVLYYF